MTKGVTESCTQLLMNSYHDGIHPAGGYEYAVCSYEYIWQ